MKPFDPETEAGTTSEKTGWPRRNRASDFDPLVQIPTLLFMFGFTFWTMRLLDVFLPSGMHGWFAKALGLIAALLIGLAVGVFLFSTSKARIRVGMSALALMTAGAIWEAVDNSRDAERERARATATEPPRTASVEEFAAVYREAAYKWFSDIEGSGAHGAAGEEPPFLTVQIGSGSVSLTNITDIELQCVALRRATGSGEQSCRLDSSSMQCKTVAPGATLTLQTPTGEHCIGALLEFRIGDVANAEPTWWSDSAREEWRRNLVGVEKDAEASGANFTTAVARGARLSQLEADLKDHDRARRWRDKLEEWAQLKAALKHVSPAH